MLLSYLHHFADVDKDGTLCLEELQQALAPYAPTPPNSTACQQRLVQVGGRVSLAFFQHLHRALCIACACRTGQPGHLMLGACMDCERVGGEGPGMWLDPATLFVPRVLQ